MNLGMKCWQWPHLEDMEVEVEVNVDVDADAVKRVMHRWCQQSSRRQEVRGDVGL